MPLQVTLPNEAVEKSQGRLPNDQAGGLKTKEPATSEI
jgi:hypothetical protein